MVELERELEKVRSKKTNLGNKVFFFFLFYVDCTLINDLKMLFLACDLICAFAVPSNCHSLYIKSLCPSKTI